jgi:glycosyltransferase involved in cell wall biosynthesis
MRLILIGTDRALFGEHSVVGERLARFGTAHTESQDSIVFSTHAHGAKHPVELAANVHAYPTNSLSRLLYGWDALRIAKHLPRPDIVSAQDPFETGLAAYFIARHFGVPFAVEVHTDLLSPEFARHSLLNRLRLVIANFVMRRASGGYAVSQRVRDGMVKKYSLAVPFGVFPIFVDLKKFHSLPRTPKKGNLLWIGRFAKEKNPALAIKALAAARAARHDVRLTLLGSGPLESSLRALTKHLGLESFVTFAGWKDPAEYLPEAELVLATSEYEGYGMSIVEALSAGVPVLSTDVGVAREAGAIVVGSMSEADYSSALCDWLSSLPTSGILKMHIYENETDYFFATQTYYNSIVDRSKLSLVANETSKP